MTGVGQRILPRGLIYALAFLGAPPLLRGMRGTRCTAKGSDVSPGVRLFCVTGVAHCKLSRGLMYTLVSVGVPVLLRTRRGRMCIAKRYNKCIGFFGLRFFYVIGMG